MRRFRHHRSVARKFSSPRGLSVYHFKSPSCQSTFACPLRGFFCPCPMNRTSGKTIQGGVRQHVVYGKKNRVLRRRAERTHRFVRQVRLPAYLLHTGRILRHAQDSTTDHLQTPSRFPGNPTPRIRGKALRAKRGNCVPCCHGHVPESIHRTS